MTCRPHLLLPILVVCLFWTSCTHQYDRNFRSVQPEQVTKAAGWEFKPEMVSFKNAFKEAFDDSTADLYWLAVYATSLQSKLGETVEAVSLDSVLIRFMQGQESHTCVVTSTTTLSYSSDKYIRSKHHISSATSRRYVFIPDSVDTINLEFDAVLRPAGLTKSRRSAVGYDSLVVDPGAPERRVPVRITMVRHEPRRLVPYPFIWMSQH
jgi:hypothetical protein